MVKVNLKSKPTLSIAELLKMRGQIIRFQGDIKWMPGNKLKIPGETITIDNNFLLLEILNMVDYYEYLNNGSGRHYDGYHLELVKDSQIRLESIFYKVHKNNCVVIVCGTLGCVVLA
jgi:hypothetical protein